MRDALKNGDPHVHHTQMPRTGHTKAGARPEKNPPREGDPQKARTGAARKMRSKQHERAGKEDENHATKGADTHPGKDGNTARKPNDGTRGQQGKINNEGSGE
ncbi:hypothetical protein HDU96_003633, partial [Phlyctochytrium bullatum]